MLSGGLKKKKIQDSLLRHENSPRANISILSKLLPTASNLRMWSGCTDGKLGYLQNGSLKAGPAKL